MARQLSNHPRQEHPFTELERRRIAYLTRDDTPLYSLPELADRLGAFAAFLDAHREFLTATGLPPVPFGESRWLYLKLGRLYDTRATSCSVPFAELFTEHPDRPRPDAPPYEWRRVAPLPPYREFHLGGDIQKCEYHEADLLKGLIPDDAERIERDRGRLLDVKRRVVARAERAVRGGAATGFWADCLEVLAEQLRSDDVEFLLRMDRFYLERDVRGEQVYHDNPEMIPGGLTDLLEVVGHVEEELAVGTLAATRAVLPDPVVDAVADPTHVVTEPERVSLAVALRVLAGRADRKRRFWAEYRQRVVNAFSRDFRVNVPIAVLPRHLELFAPLLERFRGHLEDRVGRGEPTTGPFVPTDKPAWDAERRELFFRGAVVRKLRRYRDSPLDRILAAFEEEGWPPRIDDPLPTPPERDANERRYEYVKSLNDGLTGIVFFTSGDGYGWRERPTP